MAGPSGSGAVAVETALAGNATAMSPTPATIARTSMAPATAAAATARKVRGSPDDPVAADVAGIAASGLAPKQPVARGLNSEARTLNTP